MVSFTCLTGVVLWRSMHALLRRSCCTAPPHPGPRLITPQYITILSYRSDSFPGPKSSIYLSLLRLSSLVMEAVGLAVGVAGLAGLFSACIDCFELVQRGRYHGRDYLLLETKFTNQRLRLRTWGRACGLTNEKAEDASDILGDHELRASVENTLAHLFALFRDGRALRTKYGLKEDQPSQGLLSSGSTKIGAMVSNRLSGGRLGHMLQELGDTVSRTQKEAKMTSKVKWAIEDKVKFAELVQHLKDLIDDLDGLTRWLAVPERQERIIRCEVESISDIDTLETMEEARIGRLDVVSDAASVRLWELRDRYLEDVTGRSPQIVRRSSHASNVSSEDGWHDVTRDSWRPPDYTVDSCYRVLHKVSCPHAATAIYLDAPNYNTKTQNDHQWVVLDDERPTANSRGLHLCGQRPVPDLEVFLAHNDQLSFVVFIHYTCHHDGTQNVDSEPAISSQSIYLSSQELCTALIAVLKKALLPGQLSVFQPRYELRAPYFWFYRARKKLTFLRKGMFALVSRNNDVKALLEVITTTMSEQYAAVDALISNGSITWEYLPYVFVSTAPVQYSAQPLTSPSTPGTSCYRQVIKDEATTKRMNWFHFILAKTIRAYPVRTLTCDLFTLTGQSKRPKRRGDSSNLNSKPLTPGNFLSLQCLNSPFRMMGVKLANILCRGAGHSGVVVTNE